MGQPRRRERNRLRHRPLYVQGSNLVNAVQWAVGLELLLLINDSVAGLPDNRSSQRRLFLALSGNHPVAHDADYRKEA